MPSTAIDFHRLMVHFPVALLTFAAFFQLLAVWRKSVALQTVAKALLLAGAGMGAAAVLFGFLAEEEFRNRFLETHETLGFATLGTAVVVAALWLWKPVAEPRSRGGLLVLGGLCVIAGLVGATGYLGGAMAHGHGTHGPFAGGVPAPQAAASEVTTLPAELEPAFAMFTRKCATCHGLDKPLQAPIPSGEWPAVVATMAERSGGAITAGDQAVIVGFLQFRTAHPAVKLPPAP
jgi:uncharacterized membrane protein